MYPRDYTKVVLRKHTAHKIKKLLFYYLLLRAKMKVSVTMIFFQRTSLQVPLWKDNTVQVQVQGVQYCCHTYEYTTYSNIIIAYIIYLIKNRIFPSGEVKNIKRNEVEKRKKGGGERRIVRVQLLRTFAAKKILDSLGIILCYWHKQLLVLCTIPFT